MCFPLKNLFETALKNCGGFPHFCHSEASVQYPDFVFLCLAGCGLTEEYLRRSPWCCRGKRKSLKFLNCIMVCKPGKLEMIRRADAEESRAVGVTHALRAWHPPLYKAAINSSFQHWHLYSPFSEETPISKPFRFKFSRSISKTSCGNAELGF